MGWIAIRGAVENDLAPVRILKAREKKANSFFHFLALGLFSVLVSACPLPNAEVFAQPPAAKSIFFTANQLTLSWNPPATGSSSIVSYVISYRVHGTPGWTTLATVAAAAQPSYVVTHSAIGNGSFDFAVVALTSSGAKSTMHTSLDSTAVPNTGWFLIWEVP